MFLEGTGYGRGGFGVKRGEVVMYGVFFGGSAGMDWEGVAIGGPGSFDTEAEFVAFLGGPVVLIVSIVTSNVKKIAAVFIVCVPAASETIGCVEPWA
jgi:hypothetical protein